MPTYRIDRPGMDLPRVVEADTPASAQLHVVRDEISVRRIEVAEAFALAAAGCVLERAGETPPEPAQQEPGDEERQPDEPTVEDDEPGDSEFSEDDQQGGGEPEFYGEGRDSED